MLTISHRSSQNWVEAGHIWPGNSTPTATDQFTGETDGNLWAPDIHYTPTGYYLYYSASTLGSSHSGIFLAWSATGGNGEWEDRGIVIQTSTTDDFNAIDP